MRRAGFRVVSALAVGAALACGCAHAGSSGSGGGKIVPAHLHFPASPFVIRGVVEGFYGPPWSTGATRDVLTFMGARGMNTFVYAPKFDPYQRAEWKKPYPAAQLAALRLLVGDAARQGITFVYSISPGLSITYSSAADRSLLLAKIRQLRGIGIHAFMLSFDDLGNDQLDPADAAAYPGGLGQAQVSLANSVFAAARRAEPRFSLLFTPTEYWGVRDDAYSRALAGLAPAIDVVWTGPGVVSPEITLAQARMYGAIVGRKPVVWYNYPANDWTVPKDGFNASVVQPRTLFMGPVHGLAPDLAEGVRGILANPMLQAHASEIPLASLAAYLDDPLAVASSSASAPAPIAQDRAFTPESAWAVAVAAAGGPAHAALLQFCQAQEPYPTISPTGVYGWSSTDPSIDVAEDRLLAAYRAAPAVAMASAAAASLRAIFTGWMQGPVQLAPGRLADARLGEEIAPWVRWMPRDGEAGLDALALLRATAGGNAPAKNLLLAAVRQDETTLATQPVEFGGHLSSFLTRATAAAEARTPARTG